MYKQQKDGTIVISGFEQGIADSPYDGISDMRNVNLISIPGEASVNFATQLNTPALVSSGTVVSADAGADTITISGASGFVNGNAVVFAGGSLPTGITAGTVYWLFGSGSVYGVYSDFNGNTLVNITADGTGTFTVYGTNAQFKYMITDIQNATWAIDSNGLVWTNSGGLGWRFTGNTGGTGKHGNGLVYYVASDNTSFVFAFSDGQIDYQKLGTNGLISGAWVYGWKPSTAATGQSSYLKNTASGGIHESIVAPDNKVYYCDANFIGRWYQKSPTVAFVPTTASTYVFDETQVLPFTDTAQCLAPLGNTLLIGGKQNIIYPWDTFSSLPSYPILVAEKNIVKMVTINTNTYALVGSRGRIYVTNGSQAVLFKKIPDHLSGTVEPYFTWGALTSNKNQLYFSASATTNGGGAITAYGGLWAIDIDTKALRLVNKLSYGTYAGYATCAISNLVTNPAGTGLYIAWDSGTSTYGIDITIGTPYTGSQAYVDSDLIPIGTFLIPKQFEQVEYKLTAPMVSGESVSMYYRLNFTDSYTLVFTKSTAGTFSGNSTESTTSLNFGQAQWIQIRTVINSTASSPSYTRLKEMRIK